MSEHKHVRTLKANRRERVLPILSRIYDADRPVTAKEVNATFYDVTSLASEGLVKPVASRQTGRRGRPAVEYKVTDAGRKRVKRARS